MFGLISIAQSMDYSVVEWFPDDENQIDYIIDFSNAANLDLEIDWSGMGTYF